MFITALFTIARTQKLPKCPLTDEWTKKIWYICTMEYYSAIKNEIVLFAAAWMDLGIMILSEVGQTKYTGDARLSCRLSWRGTLASGHKPR